MPENVAIYNDVFWINKCYHRTWQEMITAKSLKKQKVKFVPKSTKLSQGRVQCKLIRKCDRHFTEIQHK